MADSSAVIQVPIFCPMIRGMAMLKETMPVVLTAWRMPTEADELWIRAVTSAPTITPSTGLENATKRL